MAEHIRLNSFEALRHLSSEEFEKNTFVPEKGQKYTLVSTVAYLAGIDEKHFGDHRNFEESEYRRLERTRNARIVRNLCILRNAIERKFTKLLVAVKNEGRSLLNVSEYIPQDVVLSLNNDGVRISQKSNADPVDYLIEINSLISDRINNCKNCLPSWINWQYIKELFIMPNGNTKSGVKEAGELFRNNFTDYPYQAYLNLKMISEDGNILYNDQKFAKLLYDINQDYFTDWSKVTDVSEQIKGDIYQFLDDGEKIDMIVDCENSDVYNIISMLNSLDADSLAKIRLIILVNDSHTNDGWKELEKCTDIPIEHIMVSRVLEGKSLVDGTVIAKAFMEHYEHEVDSFILLSSDSDFWTMISGLKAKVQFLVMVEHLKCSPDYKEILADAGILCCYLDDFNSGGEADKLKNDILLGKIDSKLESKQFSLDEILQESLYELRIDMDSVEETQFFDKYLKNMNMFIDETRTIHFERKKK